ncbi:hypothetical protein [Pseudosulfitobacter sp. DSM 107133]|uniref:hypothetical protein n=1 Tax=Pseudosulfitobacter sp. DSM 107133 TaxID=2883100 RepID=UPI000DF44588|nr:hypothetical protein [Pseudosulfitobacter sp. DSM 107133]UOA28198.1 hypothetical protein DSM107133_02943 [Pseudosulfitobacter sp. DSM 107133]
MFRAIVPILAISLATPTLAQSFRAPNDLRVAPLADGSFEVIEGRGAGARALWCAAADYARKVLLEPDEGRLYVVAARGDSQSVAGRKAVTFGLTAQGAVPRQVFVVGLSAYHAGSNLSVGHARTFCTDARLPGGL